MVVLKTRKGSYWVVNTLLDSLSNETMIEIAKGLKPLPRGRLGARVEDRNLRSRLRRPRHRRLLRRARPRRRRPRHRPGEDRRPAPRRGADLRAGPRGAARPERRAASLHARRARGARRRRVPLHLRRHAAALLGRCRSVARLDGRRRAAGGPARDDRDEVHRARRHRREGARRAGRAGAAEHRLRVESRVHCRGHGGARLHAAGSCRRRRVRRRRTATASRRCTQGSTRPWCAPTSTPRR